MEAESSPSTRVRRNLPVEADIFKVSPAMGLANHRAWVTRHGVAEDTGLSRAEGQLPPVVPPAGRAMNVCLEQGLIWP